MILNIFIYPSKSFLGACNTYLYMFCEVLLIDPGVLVLVITAVLKSKMATSFYTSLYRYLYPSMYLPLPQPRSPTLHLILPSIPLTLSFYLSICLSLPLCISLSRSTYISIPLPLSTSHSICICLFLLLYLALSLYLYLFLSISALSNVKNMCKTAYFCAFYISVTPLSLPTPLSIYSQISIKHAPKYQL